MSRRIVRTLSAFALAVALATSFTAAFAATPSGEPAFYVTKKKTTTLVGLSPELRASAVQKARSLTAEGTRSQSGSTDAELDEGCNGDWFITWEEDAAGYGIVGTYLLHCDGTAIHIG